MLVTLFIVIIIALFALLNVFTLALPRLYLRKRQDVKNAERHAFAMSYGWYFQPYAPELLTRYGCLPFTERGDRRVVFGLVAGSVDGMQVTAFDYQRRTKTSSYGAVVYSDTNQVVTVWTVKLPVALPFVAVSKRRLFMGEVTELHTPDPEFNRRFVLENGDPNLAAQLLTPQVTGMMQQLRLDGWSIQGDELLYPMDNVMTRTTPQEIVDKSRSLLALVRSFPPHIWGGAQIPPAQIPPAQPPAPAPQHFPQPQGWTPQPGHGWPQGYPPNGGYPQAPPRY